MVEYIYYKIAAGNSIRSQLGVSLKGNRYGTEKACGTEKASGTARPACTKSHLAGHSPPDSKASRRVGPANVHSAQNSLTVYK